MITNITYVKKHRDLVSEQLYNEHIAITFSDRESWIMSPDNWNDYANLVPQISKKLNEIYAKLEEKKIHVGRNEI